ncbi:Serine/threonine protein kinase [Sandaracinus amylolyticus]|nr:Serine/threonine protein kinase [Sandaracinus amylolyticus]
MFLALRSFLLSSRGIGNDVAVRRSLDPTLQPGATLDGRFRLVREIAAGAMGAVWEAIDTTGRAADPHVEAGTVVALKVLRPELHSEPSIRRRFRREASVLQSISHPAVVRILDLGTDAGDRSYTVMELLKGETLEARLARDRRLDAPTLAPMLRAIADGLGAVHAHGVIHGDLKPSNVFLTEGGETPVKIVDFGLSKIEGLERLTRTGELTGTPAYMAPELLTGASELDARLDQYALGVVLYQALAGRLPFVKVHPGALMFEIVMGQGTPLREAAPDVPEAVCAVVAKAMAPKREDRYADVLELARALEAASA